MGFHAGLKALSAVANTRTVLSIEALCAAQALDLRAPLEPSPAASSVRSLIREQVPSMMVDRFLSPQIATVERMLSNLVDAAALAVGGLE